MRIFAIIEDEKAQVHHCVTVHSILNDKTLILWQVKYLVKCVGETFFKTAILKVHDIYRTFLSKLCAN